jgi:hypothetical protein
MNDEEFPTCRICFEQCTEECTCKCVGFVHKECQERWINTSGRHDCEVCKTPFEDEVVYEWDCSLGDQRCYCGSQQNYIILMIVLTALNISYALSLTVTPKWIYCVGIVWALIPLLMVLFFYEPIGSWNTALLWKWSSFAVLTTVYTIQADLPISVSTEEYEARVHYIEVDAMVLCVIFILRVSCLSVRSMRVRRLTTPPDTSDTMSVL